MVRKRADIPATRGRALKPRVALGETVQWIDQQLAEPRLHSCDRVARKIVETLSLDDLRALPPEVRRRLSELLKIGRISDADRCAVDKLLSAELVEVEYQRQLIIKGSPDFVEKTRAHLRALSQMQLGKKLLRSLLRSGRQVTIVPANRMCEAPPDDFKAALAKGTVLQWRDQSGRLRTIKGTGTGSNTTIRYNPDMKFSCSGESLNKNPPEIGLAHELVHADDAAYGRLDPGLTGGVRNYECQAVGLPPYEQKEFTENRFRAQWRDPLPARTGY